MRTKQFDCVEMMHRGAKRIYEATKGLSRAEELEYWRRKTNELLPNDTKRQKNTPATRKERKTRGIVR